MTSSDVDIIIPNMVKTTEKLESEFIDNSVVFKLKDIPYKGIVKWFGKVNDFKAFGIQSFNKIRMGTNGIFNNISLFQCEKECGIIVGESVKLLKIDSDGSIKEKDFGDLKVIEYENYLANDLVVVKFRDNIKVGKYYSCGYINEIICCGIKFKDDTKEFVFVFTDILGKFVNINKFVNPDYDGKYNIQQSDDVHHTNIGDEIKYKFNGKDQEGKLEWKGTIDGFRCIAIESYNSEITGDFRNHFDNEAAYWVVICLDSQDIENIVEDDYIYISDPFDKNIFTYFKIKAFVKLSDADNETGIVERFVWNKQNTFLYCIKLDYDEKSQFFPQDKVKSAVPIDFQNKAFFEIDDPSSYGIITKFKIGDHVQINPTPDNKLHEECYGIVAWLGFDRDINFKILLYLDKVNEMAYNGDLFGQHLCVINDKRGFLVLPSCLVPEKTEKFTKQSEIIKEYISPRYKINEGNNFGIQGDKNSCYMDTSLFSMFTFQEIFDNLYHDVSDSSVDCQFKNELRQILRSHIIFPLRSKEYVSFDRVSVFREKLNTLFPDKKFVHNEKDPEELLETLFHLLTPNDPLLNTCHIENNIKQSCFLTQLFYIKKSDKLNNVCIIDMLNWTFLESDILIDKPPKCLILQLPRHGNRFKNFKEVQICSKLNITNLIRCCDQKCEFCSCSSTCLCKICSNEQLKFIYLCDDHKSNCFHDKILKNENSFKGKVELELFAILCIEKTHYVAYVKTGEVINKWIYFDSMASFENYELKPLIRETYVGKYFENGVQDDSNFDDILRIKQFAFVCFYKNPTMEYYSRDFNHIEK